MRAAAAILALLASGCFTVSGAMTSLAGCSGEDFASVLRSLGYRMEKRPPPAPPASAEQRAPDSKSTAQGAEPAQPEIQQSQTESSAADTPVPTDLSQQPAADEEKEKANRVPALATEKRR